MAISGLQLLNKFSPLVAKLKNGKDIPSVYGQGPILLIHNFHPKIEENFCKYETLTAPIPPGITKAKKGIPSLRMGLNDRKITKIVIDSSI